MQTAYNHINDITQQLKLNRDLLDEIVIDNDFLMAKFPSHIWTKLYDLLTSMEIYIKLNDLEEENKYIYMSFDCGTLHSILKILNTELQISEENYTTINDIWIRYDGDELWS